MLTLAAIVLAQCCCDAGDSDVTISGYVTFPKATVFAGESYAAPGVNAAAFAPNGVATRHVVAPLDDQTVRVIGRKRGSDQQSSVIATNVEFVDGGIIFSANPGGPCKAIPVFSVTDDHVGFGTPVRRGPDNTCISAIDKHIGSLVDESGVNDHVSLTSMPRYFVSIEGRLGENHINTRPDGGCDAYEADGGCYATPAHRHGELTVFSSVERNFGGWGLEYRNPVTDGTGQQRFFVDTWGGIGQRHLLIRAQFPACPADVFETTPQRQFYVYGADEGTLMYAFDEHEWYFCDTDGWQPMRPGSGSFSASSGVGLLGLAGLALVVIFFTRKRTS